MLYLLFAGTILLCVIIGSIGSAGANLIPILVFGGSIAMLVLARGQNPQPGESERAIDERNNTKRSSKHD